MLINIEYKKQAVRSKYINSYSIIKMTHFTPCGVKRVSDLFSTTGVGKQIYFIDFIPESIVGICNASMHM
jgi:hypothetical protein